MNVWTENPCVGGSIPPLATALSKDLQLIISFVINKYIIGSNSISNTKKQIASIVRELHHMHSTPTNSSQSDTLQVSPLQIRLKDLINMKLGLRYKMIPN